jgi:hypothetical protein
MGRAAITLFFSFSIVCAAYAQTSPGVPVDRARTASVFTFYLENDYFGGTDRHYTNGVKLSWLSRDLTSWGQVGWRQKLIEALPLVNRSGAQKNLGVALGQNIYA